MMWLLALTIGVVAHAAIDDGTCSKDDPDCVKPIGKRPNVILMVADDLGLGQL